ncbi:MAG: hypothetical protein C0598_04775 [Marinilabiliales bacterium]|nr:MAG: hypothetical protein C0598_04775 [Marinilabiliales bacterium]
MRKLIYLSALIIAFGTFSVNAQQVEREMVVLEIATGTWCYYCPGSAMGADEMIENGHDVAIIEYHNGDDYTNAEGNYRNNYYNVSGIPTSRFDGVQIVNGGDHDNSLYPQYLPRYNIRKAVMSSFTIDVVGTTAGFEDYFTEITIEKVAASNASNIKLHVVVNESGIEENWQGMSELNFVERLMAPNQYGTDVDFSSGETQVYNIDFSVEDDWVYENCELIVFIQDNSSKEILQGLKMNLTDFGPANDYDVAIKDLKNIPDNSCAGELSPIVTIRNNSEIELTQVDISYNVNNEETSSIQWTGSLAYLETTNIELPGIEFTTLEENEVTVYTSNPNGLEDEFLGNDTVHQSFGQAIATTEMINLMLRLDDYPEQTSWELKNSDGEILYSGGDYTVQGQTISEQFTLDINECYSFALYDEAGDGLELPGFYYLYYGSGTEILQGSSFGSMISTEFSTSIVGTEEIKPVTGFEIYPNPFSNKAIVSLGLNSESKVNINIYNLQGQNVMTLDRGILSQGNHEIEIDASELSKGIYFLNITLGRESKTEKIIIE